jgi:sigma-B regulation protein RsbU (phosphoserine phosphatase)
VTETTGNQNLNPLEKENQRLRMAVEELSILNEIAITISSAHSLDRVVELIVQKCIKHLKVEQGAVMLLQEENQDSPFRTMVRQADASTMSRILPFRLDTQLTGWMLKNQKPLVINDFDKDDRFQKGELEDFSIRSLLSVPLRLKGKMIGLLTVFNKKIGSGFSDDDQRLLSIISAQSAQVIDNARLHEEEKTYLMMQEQMRLARDIQMRLLPESSPKIEGYEIAGYSVPAQEVGGDYYDFISYDEDQLAICLGDVSGKGIPAAMLMSNLQATLRGQVLTKVSPKECLSRANTLLYHSTDFKKFATVFYGVLDFKNHQLVYTNGGHDDPIFLSKDKEPQRLSSGGTVLGFVEEFAYTEDTIPLKPADFFVIYSDGITEAMNLQEEEFGEERLMSVIKKFNDQTPQKIIDEIIKSVDAHVGTAPQMDDMTLVVIKRTK